MQYPQACHQCPSTTYTRKDYPRQPPNAAPAPVRIVQEISQALEANINIDNVQIVPNQDALLMLKQKLLNKLLNAVSAAKGCCQKIVYQASIRCQIVKHIIINNLPLATLLAVCKVSITAEIKKKILKSQILKSQKYLLKEEKAQKRLAGKKLNCKKNTIKVKLYQLKSRHCQKKTLCHE